MLVHFAFFYDQVLLKICKRAQSFHLVFGLLQEKGQAELRVLLHIGEFKFGYLDLHELRQALPFKFCLPRRIQPLKLAGSVIDWLCLVHDAED